MNTRRLLIPVPVLLLTLSLTGCQLDLTSSGSSGKRLDFAADLPNPPAGSISMQEFPINDGSIQVAATSLQDVAFIEYDLVWDENVARFDTSWGGLFLGDPEGLSELVVTQSAPGRLHVKHQIRSGSPTGSGSGMIHGIDFDPCDSCSGQTGLFFENLTVLDGSGSPVPVTLAGGVLSTVGG